MVKRRTTAILIPCLCASFFFLSFCADLHAQPEGPPISLTAYADWMLGFRGGLEVDLDGPFLIRADVGFTLLGLLTADVMGGAKLWEIDEGVELDLFVGIPNFATPVTIEGAMLSIGGSLRLGIRLGEKLWLDIRAGGGFPFFFEHDKDVIRHMAFWPDACVGLRFVL